MGWWSLNRPGISSVGRKRPSSLGVGVAKAVELLRLNVLKGSCPKTRQRGKENDHLQSARTPSASGSRPCGTSLVQGLNGTLAINLNWPTPDPLDKDESLLAAYQERLLVRVSNYDSWFIFQRSQTEGQTF